ncbi:MAG: radical SAM family heme chaperone HemW [Limisphaerales bacterium]
MSAAALTPDKIESLYVHVPFCGHKCEYCAFYSKIPAADVVNGYVEALITEMEIVADDLRPRTIFFGGGTPSLLSISQWRTVLEAMGRLNLLGAEEWTVECNPATVSADKAALLRDFGVNRISMGVQSLDERLLGRLGRIHSREQVFKSYEILRSAGFENINLDLMFGIPTQTMEIWHRTLEEIVALGTEHLSCYEVIYEEDTPLFEQLQAGQFDVDEELIEEMYEALLERSAEAGFQQYEVANFEKSDRGCQHNVNYWRGGSFYGLGPSATEYVRGTRRKGWSNTQLYVERIQTGQRAHEHSETLSELGRAGETAAFGLRMNRGWGFDEFQGITKFDLREHWRVEMDDLIADELGEQTEDGFRLTRRGLRFADTAAAMFLRPDPA